MKVIGFSAGSTGHEGNVDGMVTAILEKSGHEAEFVKLTDLTYSGCKGCVKLCAKPKVCTLEDELQPYYPAIKEADAVVVGSPVYFGSINANTMAFIERFFGYRHVINAIAGKPFIVVISGCGFLSDAREAILKRLAPFEVDVLGVVEYTSRVFPCLSCGYHKICKIGGLYKAFGEEAHQLTITPELFRVWRDDPDIVTAVDAVAEKLRTI